MKLLVLLPRVPYPLEKGDKLRAFYQIKELSKYHDIYLVALQDAPLHPEALEKIEPYCKEIHLIKLSWVSKCWGIVRALLKGLPIQCGYFYSNKAKRKIKNLINKIHPDHIYCFMIRMTEYVKKYQDCHKTLDYQDVLSMGMKRRLEKAPIWKKPIFLYEYQALRRYEKNIFPHFTNKIIITSIDRDLIHHPQKQYIQVVSNGIDFEKFSHIKKEKIYDLIFAGNMLYPPNIDAVLFLVKSIFPKLLVKFPHLKLCICGATPAPAIKALASENITVTGWVDEMAEYYAQSKIFIAPMQLGTGLQNKLLEAMAMKLPCVTSPLAGKPIEGAQNHHSLLICNTVDEYVETVSKLLNDTDFYHTIAENGYQFVKANYDWEEVGKKLEEVMNED
ncbi:MAG: glycosyltransferase [Bacteroidetes bacterium]|nr:glycosyltransferase [Bacteroidota bacterium]MCL2302006.1 glycosyltransferase [Lentimicrobiaceae bacterium]